MVLSHEPEATLLPQGENATEKTELVCPFNFTVGMNFGMSSPLGLLSGGVVGIGVDGGRVLEENSLLKKT